VFDASRTYLRAKQLPADDAPTLPTSTASFSDGGTYKWEVAAPVGPQEAALLIERCEEHGVFLNQITQTVGVMRLLHQEIVDLVQIARDADRQLVLAVGPRGTYDVSAQRLATGAASQASAFRLRGVEQVLRAIEDVRRATDLGVNGFLIFDEGLLWLLAQMRADGTLPETVRFKASSGMGVANPFHCRVIADLGADTINLQRDLELGMIAAAREAVDLPFDLHTDNPASTGGFIRIYEAPEMVRVAAPVYLKAGNSLLDTDDAAVTEAQIAGIAHEIAVQSEAIARHLPEARQSRQREI
jgi:hypothetical protein